MNILAGDYGGEMDPHGVDLVSAFFFLDFSGGLEENDGAD
jgi:hypothetical protein